MIKERKKNTKNKSGPYIYIISYIYAKMDTPLPDAVSF